MHNTRHIISFAVLLFVFAFSPAFAAVHYENLVVNSISVEIITPTGPNCRESATLCAKLKTRPGDLFSQNAFDCDLKLLSLEYDRIEPCLSVDDCHLNIVIKVWPKPTIRSINWDGNCKIRTSDLRSELGINACSPFDRQCFNRAFHKLQAYYIKAGYFESEIDYETTYDECTNQVDIFIKICEGRSGKIKDICLINFTPCEKEEIQEMMVTKRYILLTSWLSGEGIYHEEAIQHDRMQILNYLHNKGYADADVRIELAEIPCYNRILVKVIADKGECYRLGKIAFCGNTLFDNETIREVIGLCPCDAYSPEEIHCAVQRLNRLYGRIGYIDAFINFESKLRCDENIYDIKFTIEEGQQYRVGMIKIMGNCVTQTDVILNETLLIPGQLFDSEALCKTEARLLNIGYFKKVNVYAVRPEGNSPFPCNFRNVHIEVEEDSTGNIGAFGGFSTMENLFMGVNVTERNFRWRGLRELGSCGPSALRGGGEYAHITLSVGAKSRRAILSWTKPYFHDTLWSIGFDIEGINNRFVSDDYDINTIGLTLHATYDVNAYVKTGVHYRIKYATIVTGADASEELKHEAHNSGLISAVGASWIYDSTNHPQAPTRGFKSRLEGECAGVGGKQSFLSFAYLNNWYVAPDPIDKGYFVFKADFKFIMPYGHTSADEVPIEERFFLGGDETVRGFRPYALGPKFKCADYKEEWDNSTYDRIRHKRGLVRKDKLNKVTNVWEEAWVPACNEDDPTGGLSLQYYSIEYDRVLNSRAEGFLFTDFGALSTRRLAFGHLYASYGLGVRLKVVPGMPPLTLGMGWPVNAKDHSDVKRFFFTIGGKF